MTNQMYMRWHNLGLRLLVVVVLYGVPTVTLSAPSTFTISSFLILAAFAIGNLAADIYERFRLDPEDESFRTPEHE
jgi:hypothetical protein